MRAVALQLRTYCALTAYLLRTGAFPCAVGLRPAARWPLRGLADARCQPPQHHAPCPGLSCCAALLFVFFSSPAGLLPSPSCVALLGIAADRGPPYPDRAALPSGTGAGDRFLARTDKSLMFPAQWLRDPADPGQLSVTLREIQRIRPLLRPCLRSVPLQLPGADRTLPEPS